MVPDTKTSEDFDDCSRVLVTVAINQERLESQNPKRLCSKVKKWPTKIRIPNHTGVESISEG